MTMRCSDCGISYPMGTSECLVCGEKCNGFNNAAPDADWREKVESMNQVPSTDWDDAVPRWRYAQLMRAGYSPREAETLAAKPHWEVDLHRAEKLAAEAGPTLAYEILI